MLKKLTSEPGIISPGGTNSEIVVIKSGRILSPDGGWYWFMVTLLLWVQYWMEKEPFLKRLLQGFQKSKNRNKSMVQS